MPRLDLTRQPGSDPTLIYRYRDGLYAADLLTTALVWLDFFTWLDLHPSNTSEICGHFEINHRPADVMLTLFSAMGLIRRQKGVFSLTELAREHLVKNSPWFLGPYYASLKERPICKDFLDILLTGKPANWGSFKYEKAWAQAMEEPIFARQFTSAMDCRGIFLGRAMAQTLNLRDHSRFLDIAGGSGIYSCCVVAANAHMHATVFEKPPVNKIASRLIAERGYADRVTVLAGDMFCDALPSGHDVHLFSNVLHDWDEPVLRQLLASSFKALPTGGMLVVHDAHINADKSGPLHVAEYSAMLMHSTEGKCYSIREMEEYLQDTGLVDIKFTPTAAARSIITARKAT